MTQQLTGSREDLIASQGSRRVRQAGGDKQTAGSAAVMSRQELSLRSRGRGRAGVELYAGQVIEHVRCLVV